jgi:hypothetical protein
MEDKVILVGGKLYRFNTQIGDYQEVYWNETFQEFTLSL